MYGTLSYAFRSTLKAKEKEVGRLSREASALEAAMAEVQASRQAAEDEVSSRGRG